MKRSKTTKMTKKRRRTMTRKRRRRGVRGGGGGGEIQERKLRLNLGTQLREASGTLLHDSSIDLDGRPGTWWWAWPAWAWSSLAGCGRGGVLLPLPPQQEHRSVTTHAPPSR